MIHLFASGPHGARPGPCNETSRKRHLYSGHHMQNMERIYQDYFTTVYKYVFCLTGDAELSEELTQETFYQALKTVSKFRGDCKVSVWLCQIAKYTWFKYCRERNRLPTVTLDSVGFMLPARDNPEDETADKETLAVLYGRIAKLDENTREVMQLRLAGELGFREIGDILGRNETWARVTFYRGKQRLFSEEEK